MKTGIETRLDQLAEQLVERFFDKVAARFADQEVELPLPPSDGAPEPMPRAPAPVKPKALPPATGPNARTDALQRAAAGVAGLLQREDPENEGVKSARLTELLLKQGLTPGQAKRRVAQAAKAKLIRLQGRTAAATYFRI